MHSTNFKLGPAIALTLLASMVSAAVPVNAAEPDEAAEALRQMEVERLRARREEMMQAIEQSRMEAEQAAEQARVKAEQLRVEAEQVRIEAEDMMLQSAAEREEHMRQLEQARREISRTHRELRRASQEVARAHRELALAEDRRVRAQLINLGDRAMLGVILGNVTDDGIQIIGLSPDGPAERAGLQTGDVLVSLRGENLARAEGRSAREVIFDVMRDIDEGEEIAVTVLREGKRWDFMVKPDKREPASWASYIRLPEVPEVVVAPDAVDPADPPPHVRIERIEVPPIDTAALAAEALAVTEELEAFKAVIADGAMDYTIEYDFGDFEFDTQAFSDIGAMALSDASVWFGSPSTRGIRFAELNEGLGAYFDSDHGVLVLDAPADNAFGLEAGDVVLKIGEDDVNETSDIVRALRDYDAGDAIRIAIKRNKREQSLEAVMPENRLGLINENTFEYGVHVNAHED